MSAEPAGSSLLLAGFPDPRNDVTTLELDGRLEGFSRLLREDRWLS